MSKYSIPVSFLLLELLSCLRDCLCHACACFHEAYETLQVYLVSKCVQILLALKGHEKTAIFNFCSLFMFVLICFVLCSRTWKENGSHHGSSLPGGPQLPSFAKASATPQVSRLSQDLGQQLLYRDTSTLFKYI